MYLNNGTGEQSSVADQSVPHRSVKNRLIYFFKNKMLKIHLWCATATSVMINVASLIMILAYTLTNVYDKYCIYHFHYSGPVMTSGALKVNDTLYSGNKQYFVTKQKRFRCDNKFTN